MSTAEIVRLPLLYSGQRLSQEEFFRRIDEWEASGHSVRGIERLEGVVYMPAAPEEVRYRAVAYGSVCGWLACYSALTAGVECDLVPSSTLDDDNDPEGDAILRIRPEYGGQSQTDEEGYIVGAPELIVEIAASTTQKDLELKLDIYRRNGVREYLVWETIGEEFYWFEWRDGEYVRRTPDEDGLLRSQIFPGLWLDVEALLDGKLARVLEVAQRGGATPEHAEFVARLEAQRATK
jgi:hypothetical protein